MIISTKFVDRSYLISHEGVYFFVYSVPQMIAANVGLNLPKGWASKIFHQSILYSDGCGAIQTITAGPLEGRKWYKQIGCTPIIVQVAFLSHRESARVQGNFDSTAWHCPEIEQFYYKSNWKNKDFALAVKLASLHRRRIARTGYNLGGHNSNSLVSFLWSRVSRNSASTVGRELDNPLVALSGFFRPGAELDIFDRGPGACLRTMANWVPLTVLGMWALFTAGMQAIRDYWNNTIAR